MTREELDKDMIESIEMWLREIEPKWVEKELNWLEELRNRIIKESEIPNDLEEAADEYEKKHTYQRYDGGGLTPEYDATLAEAFIAGYNLCKEQMLKEAVECELYYDGDFLAIDLNMAELGYSERDKVRVIVIPNTDEK